MTGLRTWVGAVGLLALTSSSVWAQAVAFQPVVSSFPNGATMGVTPVVSADRRYVRLTVNPVFTELEGFDSFLVPAAVSGGGINGGLPGGGLGGLAGMNGPINGPVGMGSPGQAGGFGMGYPQGSSFGSSDFEDQAYPQMAARPAPRNDRARTPAPTARRKRGRTLKTDRALAGAPATTKPKRRR